MKGAMWYSMFGGAGAVIQPWVKMDQCEARSEVDFTKCVLRELYPKGSPNALEPATIGDVLLSLPGSRDLNAQQQAGRGLVEGDVFFGLGPGGAQAAMQVFLTSGASATSVEQDLKQHQLSKAAIGSLADSGIDTAVAKRLTPGDAEVRLTVKAQELAATLGVFDDVDLSQASVVLAPAGEELIDLLPRLSPGTILILREKVGVCSPGLLQLSRAENDKGVTTAFAYMVAPVDEQELVRHLSSDASVKAELKRSAEGRRLARLRAGVMTTRERSYADHRRIGSTGSEVHCDALKLLDALEAGQGAIDAALLEVDVNRRDNKQYDVLRYVIEEQSLARADKVPADRMTALMGLLQTVVKARTAVPPRATKAEL